jgi:hypothetical protein
MAPGGPQEVQQPGPGIVPGPEISQQF